MIMKADSKIKAGLRSHMTKTANKDSPSSSMFTSKSNGKHPLTDYEHVPIGIIECSIEGKHLNVNQEICRITGYRKEELLALSIKDVTYEEDYGFDIKLHQRLVAGEIPFYKLEKRYVRKDGGIAWVELTRSVVRNSKGKVLYSVGVMLDISERKNVEEALREIKELY